MSFLGKLSKDRDLLKENGKQVVRPQRHISKSMYSVICQRTRPSLSENDGLAGWKRNSRKSSRLIFDEFGGSGPSGSSSANWRAAFCQFDARPARVTIFSRTHSTYS